MDIASMGPNGEACFGLRRCESGVRWWGSDVETMPDRAH